MKTGTVAEIHEQIIHDMLFYELTELQWAIYRLILSYVNETRDNVGVDDEMTHGLIMDRAGCRLIWLIMNCHLTNYEESWYFK